MKKREPITCLDTTWIASDSCDRELTPEEKADFCDHIAECELCQGASKQFDVLFRQIKFFFATNDKSETGTSD